VLLGYDLLYLLRGAPVVYYGDELGIIGRGGDQQARQDLFPTRVEEWKTQERVGAPPIGDGSSFDVVDHPIERQLRALASLRDSHPALATGATFVRRARGGVLVVSRIDADARREYVAAFNSGSDATRVSIPTATPASEWTPLFGTADRPRSNADGTLAFDVPSIGAVLLRADAELAASAPARPALRVARADVTPLWLLRATVAGARPVSVAFAVRGKTGGWQRIGVDDSPPYRSFLDPRRYRKGTAVHAVALARALDGRLSVSRVGLFVPRR
jgi:hypothetical protein